MKRQIAFIIPVIFCAACAPTGQFESDLRRVQSSVNDIRGFQAEQTTQISSLQDQLRRLSGKIEEIEFAQNRRMGTDLTSLKEDLTALKRRVPPPANVPSQALEDDEAMADAVPPPHNTEFADSLLKIRTGNYSDALIQLQALLQASQGAEWGGNVLFWTGVCYDGLAESKNALSAYNDLVTQMPKHRRVPLALVRQASIFQKLGDPKTSELTLKKLIAEYPASQEAQQARARTEKKSGKTG